MRLFYYWSKIFKKFHSKAIEDSIIHKTAKVEAGSEILYTIMDKHSFCGYYCEILNAEIGSFCSIANNVKIGGEMHPMSWVSMSPVFYEGKDSVKTKFSMHKRPQSKKTIIGNDVWIGQNSLIKQGVIIGTGAVIGMGSVVTKDVEPYAIVAGNPARLIRKRFDDTTIEKLLNSKWWDLQENKIYELGPVFNDPCEFLKKLNV